MVLRIAGGMPANSRTPRGKKADENPFADDAPIEYAQLENRVEFE